MEQLETKVNDAKPVTGDRDYTPAKPSQTSYPTTPRVDDKSGRVGIMKVNERVYASGTSIRYWM